MSDVRGDVDRARGLLADAESVLVLTGAGISADSGVPTFRGAGGLWRSFRPEDLATPEAFASDPRLVWEWYGERREAVAACKPNPAHLALAEWQYRRAGVGIATQNVDGLHAEAMRSIVAARGHPIPSESGGPAALDRLLEIHGTLFRLRCLECDARRHHREPIDAAFETTLPRCPECGGLERPDVVWFGEALDREVIGRAFRWAEDASVCLVVGTSAVVQPAASLATVTRDGGGRIIEVNPEETPLTTAASVSIRSGAADAVPDLLLS